MLFARRSAPSEATRPSGDRLEPARLLQDLARGRVGLSVTAAGLPGRYVSLLLEVRAQEGCVLIDELIPASGHLQVQPGLDLKIQSSLAGVPLGFTSRVLDIGEDKQGYYYRVSLPERISRRQRRQYFRVRADANRLRAQLMLTDLPPLDGEVADLSAAGLCLRVGSTPQLLMLTPGSQLDCVLFPRDGEELPLRLELRRLIEQPAGRVVLLGARLVDPTPVAERRLGKLVAELERDLARKRPRDQPSVS